MWWLGLAMRKGQQPPWIVPDETLYHRYARAHAPQARTVSARTAVYC